MKPPPTIGRYRLLDELGSGGEALVLRAVDTSTQEEVALRLALAAATFTAPKEWPEVHPGWVRWLDWGTDPQHGPWQVFELLGGKTLRQSVQSSGPLAWPEWRSFVHQSLEAVKALHVARWVHGDLNGDNFVLAGAEWKLLELPFLRFDPPPGRTALFGSIHTLSPEQLNGVKADAASDFFALGCLYYFAACGEFPHAGSSSREIAINRLRFPAEPLAEKAPHLPASWSGWVMNLLALAPKDRSPTMPADETT